MKRLATLLVGALALNSSPAATIRCDGVLGNSGADGATLVRYEGANIPNNRESSGLAHDRLGALWAFGGEENLLRLALDGRLLGSYPLKPLRNAGRDLVLAGDTLLVRVGEELFRLPITAPSGTRPEVLPQKVKNLSLNADDGKVAALSTDGKLLLMDPVSGGSEEVGVIEPGDRGRGLVLLPGGRVVFDGVWLYQAGKAREKLKTKLGLGAKVVGDFVYEFLWHMTVSRRNLDLEPAPGVIYGGSSGFFIGSLPEDGELSRPSGIAHLGGNRFAVSAPVGVIHLVEFSEERQTFEVVRRLGGIHLPAPLVLDERGRTWYYSGFWEWADNPSHALRGATSFDERGVYGMQGGVLPDGKLVFPFVYRNQPAVMCRAFESESKQTSRPVKDLPKLPTGFAIYKDGKDLWTVTVDASGHGAIVSLDSGGKVRKAEGGVRLELTSAKPAVTSLAVLEDGRFLAADQGAVVLLERTGKTFREISRWKSWDAETFGETIFLAVAGGRLWVSDTANNRVVVFALQNGQASPVGTFTGDGLETPLNQPRRIAAAGDRAVVMDWGNQRIVKLSLGNY